VEPHESHKESKYKRRLEIAVTNEPAYNTAILIITKKVLQQNTGGPG
jgi:hypothetical protein